MAHEIHLFEIPDRRLLADDAKPKVVRPTDIGEAKVIRTIFGASKIRLIRKQDKVRRTGLLATLAASVMVAAGWQWWVALQQAERLASHPPPLARMQVSAPNFQPEYPLAPPASALLKNDRKIPATIAAGHSVASEKPVIGESSGRSKPADLKSSVLIAENPVKAALIASKPQAKSLAENTSPAKKQAGMQPPKLPLPIQSAVPAVAATPVTRPDVQPVTNNSAPVVSAAQPAVKEIAEAESVAGGGQPQPAAGDNVQSPH